MRADAPVPRDGDIAGIAAAGFRRVERKLADHAPRPHTAPVHEDAPLLLAMADPFARGPVDVSRS